MPNLVRDGNNRVTPYDDPDIGDDQLLIRRIPSQALHPNSDGSYRVSSGGFSPTSRGRDFYCGMSVDLQSDLLANGTDSADPSYHPEVKVIMSLKVGEIRREVPKLLIGHDPKPDNPAHCNVWGVSTPGNKRVLLRLANWIRRPENVIKEKR